MQLEIGLFTPRALLLFGSSTWMNHAPRSTLSSRGSIKGAEQAVPCMKPAATYVRPKAKDPGPSHMPRQG